MKILIVDDDQVSLQVLERLLHKSGHEVASVGNGSEALEKLRTEAFDMVISDVLMPVMDGFQLCKAFKADEKMRKTPFVFYSGTYTDEKDQNFAKSLGADRFITKPMETGRLVEVINGILEDSRKGLLPPSSMPSATDEGVFMKEYNERLISKLEKKMLDLEEEIVKRKEVEQALRIAHDELYHFSQELEKKVEERTRELREKDRQLARAEKLAALGRMANKVAHELRNPLTAIGGFARRMHEHTPEDDPNQRYLAIIEKEVAVLEEKVWEIIEIEDEG